LQRLLGDLVRRLVVNAQQFDEFLCNACASATITSSLSGTFDGVVAGVSVVC
jgi:hypothetical protein